MRSIPEGIRISGHRRLTTPQSAFGCQLPFTGEPLVQCKFVGVDVPIDPPAQRLPTKAVTISMGICQRIW